MGNKKLHPSVEAFKKFVNNNPEIIHELRNKNVTLQELYEEWYLLGEEDPRWNNFRVQGKEEVKSVGNEEKSGEWLGQLLNVVKNMDPNQIQGHIYNLNQALAAIQGVLSQFKGGNQTIHPNKAEPSHPPHPFLFRKD